LITLSRKKKKGRKLTYFGGDYSRVIKSRLQKKLDVFVNQELPVLVEKGYLDVTEFRSVIETVTILK
jgi:hypothetical protein